MINSVSKILAALLAVLLLYLVPAVQHAKTQEDITLLTSYHALTEFVDSVRNKGYISPVMYEDFRTELGSSGGYFDVAMEHQHKKYHPEYDDPSDGSTFLNKYSVQYEGHYTEELEEVLFPDTPAEKDSKERKYYLEMGDYFTVNIQRKDQSPLNTFTSMLYDSASGEQDSPLHYGGMVLNEDY
ncbi:hypothetical protein EJP77_02780 [Paenibacillus zeisoli]|uniref:DUF3993 domain-containing protein n=1 Tax=Paenibacillus zeisoli TaxID=2496267 RepID=A0A3S1JST4_9BACL|nr:hypothetical protein [Paenibacillus zeisoli]RUT35941.1 hypothetical protein EJP77_02780 [Paenibacillus zeisoli]